MVKKRGTYTNYTRVFKLQVLRLMSELDKSASVDVRHDD